MARHTYYKTLAILDCMAFEITQIYFLELINYVFMSRKRFYRKKNDYINENEF